MLVDLTHQLDSDIPMFPGFPAPGVSDFISRDASRASYAPGTEFLIQRYSLIGNTGTYLDAPYHRYPDGADLAGLNLERLCDLPGVSVDVEPRCSAGELAIDANDVPDDVQGCAVLFRTGWDRKWKSADYLQSNPYLTGEAAERLLQRGAAVVGIDSWNVDDVRDMSRPVHSVLLRAGIPVIENLCRLERLPERGFRFFAPVIPMKHGTAVPVRAFAVLD